MSSIPAAVGNNSISSFIFNNLKKVPCLKKSLSTPKGEEVTRKVLNIAIEVLKVLGIVLAGAAFGTLVGLNFGGTILIIASAVVGGLVAGIVYLAVCGVVAVIKKFAYPSNKYLKESAISTDHWLDNKYQKRFKTSLQSFEKEEWFKDWMKLKGFKKCNNFVWRRFQKGLCHGETHAILEALAKKEAQDSKDLLENLDVRTVFKKQILEIIRADFASILEKNQSETIKGLQRDKLLQDYNTLAMLTEQIDSTNKNKECQFTKTMLVNKKDFKDQLQAYMQDIKSNHQDAHLAGIIRIEGKKCAHSIFFQYEQDHYRFYDGYNERYTGFYEFPDEDTFINGLHAHLRAYVKVPSMRLTTYQKAKMTIYDW